MEATMMSGRHDGRWWMAGTIAIAVCGYAPTAAAFIDPPELIPSNPVTGDAVSVGVRSGECDAFVATPPLITRDGNALHVLLESSHHDDPLWCNNPIFTSVFELGPLPVGSYTLHVERYYDTLVPEPVFETLGRIAFSVRGQAPVALATGDRHGGILLAGVLALLGAWRAHRRSDAARAVRTDTP